MQFQFKFKNFKKIKEKTTLIILIGLILASFGLGVLFGKSQVVCKVCPPEKLDFSLFWEAWETLEEQYIEPQKIDTQKAIYGAISGMLESLSDPYTVFMDPDKSKIFAEDIAGRFEGVGMEIGIRKGELQVIAPLEGTPAYRAGIKTGDKIIKIDDKPSLDMNVDEAVSLIRGPAGTEVVLTIFREDWEETKDFKLVREIINIPSLKWELLTSTGEAGEQEGDIAYLRIYHFTQRASYDFNNTAREILNSPAKKIILDLRNNPGGYLNVAQDISSWFLKKDQVIAIQDFGGKKKEEEYKTDKDGLLSEYPVVCLINGGTASGAEIMAGALKDNREITLIGERSFGKGLIQELFELRDGSKLKITIAKWLTPKRNSISEKGIEPDIEVKAVEGDKDLQLEKAIEIIKNLQ